MWPDFVRGELPDSRERHQRRARRRIHLRKCFIAGFRVLRHETATDQRILPDAKRSEEDVSFDDLPGARIGDRLARRPAARGAVNPVDDVVADVHRVGVGGKHLHLERIRKSGGFKRHRPPGGSFDQCTPDRLRRSVVDVVDDRLDRIRHCRARVLLLEAMTRNPASLERGGERRAVVRELDPEHADSRIELPRLVPGLRKRDERVVFADRHELRNRRHARDQRTRLSVSRERQQNVDFGVAGKCPGQLEGDRAARRVGPVRALVQVSQNSGDVTGVGQEKVRRVDENSPLSLGFDLESPDDALREAVGDCALLVCVRGRRAIVHVVLDEKDFRPDPVELDGYVPRTSPRSRLRSFDPAPAASDTCQMNSSPSRESSMKSLPDASSQIERNESVDTSSSRRRARTASASRAGALRTMSGRRADRERQREERRGDSACGR